MVPGRVGEVVSDAASSIMRILSSKLMCDYKDVAQRYPYL